MVEQQTKTIGERFDDVTQAFLDQRDYATFCYDKLCGRLDKTDGRLGRIELVMSEVLNELKALTR